jgi:type I restriction enzyme M protein
MDASNLGENVKDGKNQKTVLRKEEEDQIINIFNEHKAVIDFSVVVSYEQIAEKNYSFSAGQYFDLKIEYVDITQKDFEVKVKTFQSNLDFLFIESKVLESQIREKLKTLNYEK